jgi:hypothetical protein
MAHSLFIHLPKTDEEVDQRTINEVRKCVEKEGLTISQANRMLKGYLRNKKNFDEAIWPHFISTLSISAQVIENNY